MKSPFYLWLNQLASEAIEGAADAFLIVSGGSALSQATPVALPTITPSQIGWSVLLGALWYGAAFLKKTPLPSALPMASVQKPEACTTP